MLSGLRVLLAEDNATNQLVATQMLESLGATVSVAADGVEALEMVEAEPFDVLLVDIEMPRMNGIELIRRLRGSEGAVAALPMIALTAYVMREHVAAIDDSGADGVIAKPILSVEQFGDKIGQFMAQRAALGRGADNLAAPSATAASAEAEGAVIDRTVYDGLAGLVGPAAMADLLGKVDTDLQSAAQRLEKAGDGPDLDEARAVSHILISVAGTIGAVKAQELAQAINRAGHAGDRDAVSRDIRELLTETGRVIDFVRAQGTESPA